MESSFHPVAYLVLSASRSDLQPHRQFSYRRGLSVIRSAFPCHGQSSQASFLISASACLVNGFCSRSFSFGKDASNLRFRFLISAYLPRPAMLASPDSMVLPLSLSAQLPFPATPRQVSRECALGRGSRCRAIQSQSSPSPFLRRLFPVPPPPVTYTT